MPTVLVVGQAFKESMGPATVARALEAGARGAGCAARVVVGSDGGDGLLDALPLARRSRHAVAGPLGGPVEAEVGWLDPRTAVLESRMACGLALVARGERDPRRTTTRGVGELIVAARGEGAAVVVVGLGGSATMDGGLGMARALGWEAVDAGGKPLPEGGGALVDLARLVPGPPVATRIIALADVRNRLLGPDGAAVYAPQKGADGAAVRQLTDGLARLVEAARPWDGSRLAEVAGAGAAGGLAFGLLCFAGAELMPGASWVLDRAGFENALDGADLAVVAEAGFDETSLAGKLTGEVVTRARRRGVPVLVLTPDARVRPGGVVVETTPGRWSAADLTAHAEAAIRRALRLPPP